MKQKIKEKKTSKGSILTSSHFSLPIYPNNNFGGKKGKKIIIEVEDCNSRTRVNDVSLQSLKYDPGQPHLHTAHVLCSKQPCFLFFLFLILFFIIPLIFYHYYSVLKRSNVFWKLFAKTYKDSFCTYIHYPNFLPMKKV